MSDRTGRTEDAYADFLDHFGVVREVSVGWEAGATPDLERALGARSARSLSAEMWNRSRGGLQLALTRVKVNVCKKLGLLASRKHPGCLTGGGGARHWLELGF